MYICKIVTITLTYSRSALLLKVEPLILSTLNLTSEWLGQFSHRILSISRKDWYSKIVSLRIYFQPTCFRSPSFRVKSQPEYPNSSSHVKWYPGDRWQCDCGIRTEVYTSYLGLYTLVFKQRSTQTTKLRNHVTWSECVAANHRLYRFSVLTWRLMQSHPLCVNAVVPFPLCKNAFPKATGNNLG